MEFRNIFLGIIMFGLVVAIIVMAAVKPQYDFSLESDQARLAVDGEGKVTVMPDKAEIYIKLFTIEETAEEARILNAETSKSVIAALEGAELDKKNVETYSFNLKPIQNYIEDEETYILIGYEVQHIIKATTLDIDKVGNFIDSAIGVGADGIDRVTFDLTDEKNAEVEKEALAKATLEAMRRAEAMASASDVDLVKIISIDGTSSHTPFFWAMTENRVADISETVIVPEKLEITATVELIYEIG